MSRVYKILSLADWERFQADKVFRGADIDLHDGYIHLSTAEQAPETLRLHFQGRSDLVILQFDAAALGPDLKWEEARGGQSFPHFYGALDCAHVLKSELLPLGPDGAPTPAAPLPA